jgi:glycosyltransferase involved in cell wall biosynthesis
VYGIFVHQQVIALQGKGIKIRVIAPVPLAPSPLRYINNFRLYGKIPEHDIRDGIEIYHPRYILLPRKKLFAFSGISYYHGIRRLVSEIHESFSFDLIHAHVALPDGDAGIKVKKRYSKPLITTIHGDDINNVIGMNTRCKNKILNVFDKSNRVIANSTIIKERILFYWNNPDRVRIVFNGIFPEEIERIRAAESTPVIRKNRKEKIILSVAALRKQKGIGIALHALGKVRRSYPDFRYIIVGEGPEENNLHALATRLKLGEQVEFIGKKTHDNVLEYMKICDIFLLPSWKEAFGIVYIEALAFRKPVIGCRTQGIEDIVSDGDSGLLCEPRDIDNLKEKILLLLNDEEFAKRLGEKGRERVCTLFTWRRSADMLIDVYNETIAK